MLYLQPKFPASVTLHNPSTESSCEPSPREHETCLWDFDAR